MDDEMKEPNSEQTPSASDEQKPNIEGKQVSDGADDTTSLTIDHQMKTAPHAIRKRTIHF